MSRAITLHSPLTPVALATKLRDVLGGRDGQPKAGVSGQGDERQMRLFVFRPNRQNSFAPQLTATLAPERGGTRIAGRMGAGAGTGCFLICWFGFLSLFVLGAGLAAVQGAPPEFWVTFAAIPLAMMAFGALLPWLGRRLSRGDEDAILAFLAETVQARPVSGSAP